MAEPTETVLLQFAPCDDDDGGEGALRGQLSAVVQTGGNLWVASDESNSVQRLSETEPGTFGERRAFALSNYLEMPAPDDEEADIEGLDAAGGYLWLVGSHSLKRRKAKPNGDPEKQIARLAKIAVDGNRYLLARIPLDENKHGDAVLRDRTEDGDGARTAARLMGGTRGNLLMDALRLDPHLSPFLEIPGKDNGLDIEGIAVHGNRVFLGLRGPVLRGWAVLLEMQVEEAAPGLMALAPLGKHAPLVRKHFLDLRGLGVRDLCFHGSDLLVLAGPTMDVDGPAGIFRWKHALKADEPALLGRDDLEQVVSVPYGTGEHDARDHPEGIALFAADGGKPRRLLVVYDSPAARRLQGKSGVRADLFRLT